MSNDSTFYDRFPGQVILAGIVGSTAYGLAKPGSDIDRLGVFALPTADVLGLGKPQESVVIHEPSDASLHEVKKYLNLALAANPTITELLWLPEDLYEVMTPLGRELIGLRSTLLSAPRVKGAYLGYATQQFMKMERRADGSFSSDTKNRSEKHARHMARLLRQGHSLYTTGELTVAVDNPDWYHNFGRQSPDVWADWFHTEQAIFENADTVLPEKADDGPAQDWLISVRRANF